MTCFRLEKAGYQIITAVNGKQALEVMKKELPDLVLLDLRLPVLTGPEACLCMKNDASLKGIPVIIFTASTQNIKENIKACGAQGFILKPFNTGELLAKIKEFIP